MLMTAVIYMRLAWRGNRFSGGILHMDAENRDRYCVMVRQSKHNPSIDRMECEIVFSAATSWINF